MDRLFSLVDPPPMGFTLIDTYSRRLFRRRAFALYVSTLEEGKRFLGDDLDHVTGVLIWRGPEAYKTFEIKPGLLGMPTEDTASLTLVDMLVTTLTLLDKLREAGDHKAALDIEIKRALSNQDRMADDFEMVRTSLKREITERRILEDRALDNERKIRALLDMAFVLVELLAVDGTLLDANRTSLDFVGRSLEDMKGKPFVETPWCNHSAELQERIRNAIADAAEGKETRFETQVSDALGRVHAIDFFLRPFRDDKEEVVYIISEGWDITDLKEAEREKTRLQAQLLQAQKMESIGRLAGGVAHDFNNMLSVIMGRAELALSDVPENSSSAEDFREILKTAERSVQLTRQLLVFARRQAINPVVVDLNESISKLLDMLRRLVHENIRLEWNPGNGVWHVLVDPTQLDQLLTNLTLNASDAITGAGTILFSTGKRTLTEPFQWASGLSPAGEYAYLSVRDTGGGIPSEVMEQIFEPFFTTKDTGKGTGLGLATVLGVVQQHHGFVEVSSHQGKGSEFIVYFPKTMDTVVKTPDNAPKPQRGHEMLLVVEDEELLLDIDKRILISLGYCVQSFHDPEEALRMVEREGGRIDLLITDVIMPKMTGHDLAQALRKKRSDLKVLFVSGYSADIISNQGVLEEETFFLQKPFNLNDLAAKVRKALDSR